MEDLRIPLSAEELNKPNTITVQRVCECFADIFMGVSKDQMGQQAAASVVSPLEHPDLHLESVSLVAFYRLILQLMSEVGIEDFSLRDLIRPEAGRFRLILSAVINFAKFREEQLSVFEEFSRRADEALEQRQKLGKRQDELKSRVGVIRAKRADEEPMVNRLKEEIAQSIQELRNLKKKQTDLSSELDALKSHRGETSEKLVRNSRNLDFGRHRHNFCWAMSSKNAIN